MQSSFRQIINKAVKERRLLVVPGAHDALSARLIQKIGFETYFIGGFPAVGPHHQQEPACVPVRQRLLGDELRRQVVVEVGGAQALRRQRSSPVPRAA